MRLIIRSCQTEDDYWRLRAFLREVFLLNCRRETSWQVARLDYWRYFGNPNIEHYPDDQSIWYWENSEEQIVAVLCPENRGDVHLHVYPTMRTPELETELIEAAENCFATIEPATRRRKVTVWAHQDDGLRPRLLEERGYTRGEWPEHQFGRPLSIPLRDAPLPEGYLIRSLGGRDELPARSLLSWQVFHPDEPAESYTGWEWYDDIQRCPLYRRDLDLVAVAPNGDLAAFATVWYDDVTRTGYFEPVGAAPAYRRKGIARAIMTEGMRRLKTLGGAYATVAGYSEAANLLYASLMCPEARLYERWSRTLPN